MKKGQKVLLVGYVVSDKNGKLTVEVAGHKIHGTPKVSPTLTTPAMPPPDEGAFGTGDQETTPIVDFQETTPIVD